MFGKELLKNAGQQKFNYCRSVIAWNEGNGKFRIEELPYWVQLSSVNAAEITDINGDRQPDLVLGGNRFTYPPQFGRLDGSYGQVLLNVGKGKMNYIGNKETGLRIKGEVRSIRAIRLNNRNSLLFAINSEKPVLYQPLK